MDPSTSRTTWRALEPVHSMVYFAPEAQEEYAALGLDVQGNRALGYFPARAAALGRVGPGAVHATFYNFSRRAVDAGMAGVWERVSPEQLVGARRRAADRALRRLCGALLDGPEVTEAAALARTATEGCTPYGRPLYAAHADLPEPELPHLQLWHAITLLREFRGDGHVAVLVAAGLTGLQAAVLHVARGEAWTRTGLQTSRGYSDEEWDAAIADLTERGWLHADGTFTDDGRAQHQRLEDLTDALALPAWTRLGDEGCARLRDLGQPLSDAVVAAGGIGIR